MAGSHNLMFVIPSPPRGTGLSLIYDRYHLCWVLQNGGFESNMDNDNYEGVLLRIPANRPEGGFWKESLARPLQGIHPYMITLLNIQSPQLRIEDFVYQMSNLPNLQALYIMGNKYQILPHTFVPCTKLTELSVIGYTRDNSFVLPDTLRKLTLKLGDFFNILFPKNLVYLDLQINNCDTEDAQLTIPNQYLTTLKLDFLGLGDIYIKWLSPLILSNVSYFGMAAFKAVGVPTNRAQLETVNTVKFHCEATEEEDDNDDEDKTDKGSQSGEYAMMEFVHSLRYMPNLHTLELNVDFSGIDLAEFPLCFRLLHNLQLFIFRPIRYHPRIGGGEMDWHYPDDTPLFFTVLNMNLNNNVQVDIKCDESGFIQPIAQRIIRIRHSLDMDTPLNLSLFTQLKELTINKVTHPIKMDLVLPVHLTKCTFILTGDQHTLGDVQVFTTGMFNRHYVLREIEFTFMVNQVDLLQSIERNEFYVDGLYSHYDGSKLRVLRPQQHNNEI